MSKRKNPLVILGILAVVVFVVLWQSGQIFLGGGPDPTCVNPHFEIRNGVRVVVGFDTLRDKDRVCNWNARADNRYCVYCNDESAGGFQYIKSEDRDVSQGTTWSTADTCFIAREHRRFQNDILVERWHDIFRTYSFNSIISDFTIRVIQPGRLLEGIEYGHNEGDIVFDSITGQNYECRGASVAPGMEGNGWVGVVTTTAVGTTIPTTTTTVPSPPPLNIPTSLLVLGVIAALLVLAVVFGNKKRRK